jgi:serine/threonine protein kinase
MEELIERFELPPFPVKIIPPSAIDLSPDSDSEVDCDDPNVDEYKSSEKNNDKDSDDNDNDDDDDDGPPDEDDNELEITTIGLSLQYDYYIAECLPSGKHHVVYRAVDKKSNQHIVIKVGVIPSITMPMEQRAMVQMERKNVTGVSRLVGIYVISNCMWASVMPFYKHDSISEKVWDKAPVIKLFMRQLLTTIFEMHDAGVICRDIKLSNIAWDDETQILTLLDFDLATFERKERHSSHCGTDGYMAPEIMSRDKYDRKVDLYSAGVVMCCLLFKIREKDITRKKVVSCITSMRKKRSPAKNMCLSLLSFDPCLRPARQQVFESSYFAE